MTKKETKDQQESYRIDDLAQIKALAHPLRMRIIETLASSEPMTTKQVAEQLGEKPTRLYHHVDTLEKAGLVRLTHTKQNRGTTEKYFEAVAKQYYAGASLFGDEVTEDDRDAMRPMIRTVFENTMGEMLRLVDAAEPGEAIEEEGVLSYLEMHLPKENADIVQAKLKDLLEYLQNLNEEDFGDKELRKFRLTMALYPLDRFV